MNDEQLLQELLAWRLKQAESEAPPAPRASRLLHLSRPWWEEWPARSRDLLCRVAEISTAYGLAKEETPAGGSNRPVPALLVYGAVDVATVARLHFFSLRGDTLRMRFTLEQAAGPLRATLEATFVSDDARPLFVATAHLAADDEYRVEIDLPPVLAAAWSGLTVRDSMPFRFILGPARENT